MANHVRRSAHWARPDHWVRILLGLVALTCATAQARAQASSNESQVKAAFVYNFLKFVEWPDSPMWGSRDSLVVGFVGGGRTVEAAAVLLAGKSVNGRAIAIRHVKADHDRDGLHALFIGDADSANTRRILDAVARSAVLSIGESQHFVSRGGIIGLLVEEHKIRFQINPQAATLSGLRVSSKLLALARIVYVTPVATVTPQ